MAQILIYNGILQEKKYKNMKIAEQFYTTGINRISGFGHFGNEFAAYGYFGLSRISKLNGNNDASKSHRKKALDLADFKKIDFE
jgi:hypothetical protein